MSTSRGWSPNDWIRLVALIGGFGLFLLGSWMLYHGIVAEGIVDLKSSILSGTLKSSSAGLYICFLALFIIVFVLVSLITPRTPTEQKHTSRARRLMPMFWGLLAALAVCAIAMAVLDSSARFGFSMAIGVITMLLVAVVTAMLRIVANEDA
jgi:hydrogenase-4 membrane subunit HyfE